MLKVGEVVRPYQPLSVHVAQPPTATAHTNAHVADAVAAPSPSANDTPRLKRSHAQLSSIGTKTTPTNGQPVPNTQSIDTRICHGAGTRGGWVNNQFYRKGEDEQGEVRKTCVCRRQEKHNVYA